MDTYDFCASLIAGGRVLDYGCGAGQIVAKLRQRGIDAAGCDVFYEGGDYSRSIPEDLRTFILRMEGDRIPFPDATFDVVISNQVMEHVPDLDVVTREIARVLKAGGVCITLFPDRGVWREGHCGIPFLHRFPKGSQGRVWYAVVMRALGFGTHTQERTVMEWARNFCTWLDQWTYYRADAEIHRTFSQQFCGIEHLEERWFDARLGARPFPVALKRFIVRKLAGMVIAMRKPAASHTRPAARPASRAAACRAHS